MVLMKVIDVIINIICLFQYPLDIVNLHEVYKLKKKWMRNLKKNIKLL